MEHDLSPYIYIRIPLRRDNEGRIIYYSASLVGEGPRLAKWWRDRARQHVDELTAMRVEILWKYGLGSASMLGKALRAHKLKLPTEFGIPDVLPVDMN